MDQRDSYCPYLLSSEATAKGTGLAKTTGKEDPLELDSKGKTSLRPLGAKGFSESGRDQGQASRTCLWIIMA
ncbi:hypothetical protein M0813_24237 [Anaeramoeba flamelloides]|uniref:Uncharacterized protein n=1 Tax=Anaeramoeba flamelloides TaxID=1746091 RepID=A0ABQ8XMS6_9EUKA|nr:hypothetical protein M0813_30089 [Anaeramoeba flamelloides]KAJ6233303.1 hypothetical protein M0813_30095 [Anaeramoeba flamelloides]KAJ6240379.1 hypothetical protein M0813_24237 [Anaeramoeba flamelloides]